MLAFACLTGSQDEQDGNPVDPVILSHSLGPDHHLALELHAGLVASLVVLVALFLTYFVSEIALTVRHPPDPSMDYFLTYPVDMRVAG